MSLRFSIAMHDAMEPHLPVRTLTPGDGSGIAHPTIREISKEELSHAETRAAVSDSAHDVDGELLHSPDGTKHPEVLWCLQVHQHGKSDRSFYQDEPWKGINNGLPDSDPDENMDSRAVLTYSIRAEVFDLTGKESNTVETWRDQPVDFKFGRDAILLSRLSPTMTIHAKQVVQLINAALPYYPYRLPRDHFVATGDVFPQIMHCYQELKNYFNSYLSSLAPAERDHPKLDIGNCGDENITEVLSPQISSNEIESSVGPCDTATALDLAVVLRLLAGMYHTKIVPTLTSIYFDKIPMATYDNIWVLFKPGTVVYVKQSAFCDQVDLQDVDYPPPPRHYRSRHVTLEDDNYSACVVVQAAYGSARSRSGGFKDRFDFVHRLELTLWCVKWSGTCFQRIAVYARIGKFEGSRPLTRLAVIPADIYNRIDNGLLRQRLESRGRKYVKLLGDLAAYRLYNHKNTGYTGQIIVDPEACRQNMADDDGEYPRGGLHPLNPNLASPSEIDDGDDGQQFAALVDIAPSKIDSFERANELCLLLPRLTEGFALRTKKWLIFEVDGISDDVPTRLDDQLDKELVLLCDEDKDQLRTVPPRGQRSQSQASDFVEGKGEGKIFLLYGGPGTGKTLTVECVANDTHRPLIRITAQDVGLTNSIESRLRTWFMLAAKWHAILLIDEADLFLEQRKSGDIERNSLSTVFLRTMEYYKGILFLTTNRPGQIDDSFISRVTCPIHYPQLDENTQNLIVKKLVNRFQKTDTILIDNLAATWLCKPENCKPFNGRELRNVLQNAVAEAEHLMRKAGGLSTEEDDIGSQSLIEVKTRHVQAAAKRQRDFQIYLAKVRGQDAEKRASARRDW